jgi:hypothetical protein
MIRRLSWLVPLPALLLALPACEKDDPAGPEPPTGRYTLVETGGLTLPAVVFDVDVESEEGPFRLKYVVTEGWIELDEDGGYRHQVKVTVTVDGYPNPRADWNDYGRYEVTEGGLHFSSDVLSPVIFDAEHEPGEIRFTQDLTREGRPIATVYRK